MLRPSHWKLTNKSHSTLSGVNAPAISFKKTLYLSKPALHIGLKIWPKTGMKKIISLTLTGSFLCLWDLMDRTQSVGFKGGAWIPWLFARGGAGMRGRKWERQRETHLFWVINLWMRESELLCLYGALPPNYAANVCVCDYPHLICPHRNWLFIYMCI